VSIRSIDRMRNQTEIFQELLRIVQRHLKLILLVTVVMMLVVYATLQVLNPKYETSSSLLVTIGRENAQTPTTVDNGTVYSNGVRAEEINSNIQLLRSRDLLLETIDAIGLDAFAFSLKQPEGLIGHVKFYAKKSYRWGKDQLDNVLIAMNLRERLTEREKVLVFLERSIRVDIAKESDVIVVSARMPSPDLAVTVVETLVERFRARHIQVHTIPQMLQFFETQTEQTRANLKQIDEAYAEVIGRLGLMSLGDQKKLLAEKLIDCELAIEETQSEFDLLGNKAKEAATQAQAGDEEGLSVISLKERITQLNLERIKLISTHSEESQTIARFDKEIARLQKMLARGLNLRIEQLKTRQSAYVTRLKELSDGEITLGKLMRDREVEEQNYKAYSERREESRISDELDRSQVSNVAVLSHAVTPFKPVSPRKMLMMSLSLPLGLFLGLALALLLEYFDDRITREEDLELTEGVAFLGTLKMPEPRA
jgi:uncharacterized protein involved in exopolysaccharide biosynthesis